MAHLTQDSIWTDSHMVLIGHGGLFRKVVFENGYEAALADVQIYPSTNKVSFQVLKRVVFSPGQHLTTDRTPQDERPPS
jgi:hypothetical protein